MCYFGRLCQHSVHVLRICLRLNFQNRFIWQRRLRHPVYGIVIHGYSHKVYTATRAEELGEEQLENPCAAAQYVLKEAVTSS